MKILQRKAFKLGVEAKSNKKFKQAAHYRLSAFNNNKSPLALFNLRDKVAWAKVKKVYKVYHNKDWAIGEREKASSDLIYLTS